MHITRRADQFRAIKGQILAYEYTQLLECVKEWSDFGQMEGVVENLLRVTLVSRYPSS